MSQEGCSIVANMIITVKLGCWLEVMRMGKITNGFIRATTQVQRWRQRERGETWSCVEEECRRMELPEKRKAKEEAYRHDGGGYVRGSCDEGRCKEEGEMEMGDQLW